MSEDCSASHWSGSQSHFAGRMISLRPVTLQPSYPSQVSNTRIICICPAGEFDPNHIRRQRVEGTGAEILNRYDKATKDIFENILKERKQALESKDKYHYQPVDLSKYPPWTEHVIEGLRKSFQVFDVDLSGRIEFEEL